MSVSDRDTEAERRAAGDGEEVTVLQARQATSTGRVRWVLVISLLLAVIAVGAVFLWYTSVQQGTPIVHATPTHTAQAP